MNSATFSASAPAITSMFPPTARDCSTSGGPRPCWPSCKPHDGTSPHVREHRLYLLARALTEPQEQLLDVAIAERVAEVPRDGLHDQCRLEVAALEIVLRSALQLLGKRAQDHRPPPVRRRLCRPQAQRRVTAKNFATRPAA